MHLFLRRLVMRGVKGLSRGLGNAALQLGLAGILMGTPMWAQAHDASVGLSKKQIYPPVEQANADVKQALAEAKRTHKRVLLDFGGDWCPDCQVLNYYFAQSPNNDLLAKNFIRVNVNAGHIDANLDLAKRYGVDLKGVPALSVLAPDGTVVYAQTKEFSNMRHMESSDVTQFLNQWKR